MKKLFTREMIIGLTVIIALLIVIFGINYLKGINIFKAANYYYATYDNVTGLAQSAPVTINGFKVGVVRDIRYEYDNPGHVRVEMSLNRELQLPNGTIALLSTDFLGTSTIELKLPANPTEGFQAVGDMLESQTNSGLMDKLQGEMLPAVAGLMPKIDSLLTVTTNLVANPALTNSINRLDNIMGNLEKTTESLNRSLSPILKNADASMANVSEISENLRQVSAALAAVSDDLKNMPLDSTLTNINAITENLQHATDQLNSTNSSLGLLLNDPELYQNLNNTAAHIDSILIDLKRQPKRYIPSIKIF
ncbi:MAG: MlaD family protein [Lachnoclostridium sp.]|nr:MlaD family protein [Lachnoclostridium sp.]